MVERERNGQVGEQADVRARTFRLKGGEYLVLSMRVPRDRPRAALTRAEWSVARAVLGGASNAEIANQRQRSIHTISKQVSAAYKKLGVSSRIELAGVLCGQGLDGDAAWKR